MNSQTLIDDLKSTTIVPTTVFTRDFAHGKCRCEVDASDQLASVFQQVGFYAPASLGADALKQLGEALGQRLQYLMEPIAPIELDADGATLQMRSVPPSNDGPNSRSYYELLVRSEGLTLNRYQSEGNQPRKRCEMTITHEVFARLMDDLAQAHQEAVAE